MTALLSITELCAILYLVIAIFEILTRGGMP